MQKVVMVFSDLFKSVQYVSLLNSLPSHNYCFFVLVYGPKDSHFANQILNSKADNVSIIFVKNEKELLFEIIAKLIVRPKVVFVSGWAASKIVVPIAAALLIKKRILVRHHGNLHYRRELPLKSRLGGRMIDRVLQFLSTDVVAVSNAHKDFLQSTGVRKAKLKVIENSYAEVASMKVKESPRLYRETNESDPYRIGIISRLTFWKGVDFALSAINEVCEKFPNIRVILVGYPADRASNVNDIIKNSRFLDLEYFEYTSDMQSVYRALDCLVHVPIDRFSESFGQVLVEAFFAGVPVVATPSGLLGSDSFLNDYYYRVGFQNTEDIKDALTKLLESESPLVLTSNARSLLVEKYSMDSTNSRYLKLILE